MIVNSPKRDDIPSLKALFAEAFGDEGGFIDTFFDTAFSENRARVIYKEGKISAMLYWFDCEYLGKPLAYIYAVATDKAYRGQGLCSILMQDTHKHLKSLGYSGAILVPSEPSLFNFYERLGYKTATFIGELSRESSTQGCHFTSIDKNEYARLRKEYLPKNAIIQEKENLDFLEKLATFIKGEDFLLSYSIYENKLHAYEFLGNTEKAPSILSTLGVDSGTFRGVGKARPFTMLCPFENLTPPEYFAFAFD
ncbi:MAG: GNAT family N-acetyltransferase [Ruminococcaceae bacterium]|nr:GNAT family N-acetyltransferase [Oscillospiraceae bacterium]